MTNFNLCEVCDKAAATVSCDNAWMCDECYAKHKRAERWNRTNPTRLDFDSAINAIEGKGLTYSADVIRAYVEGLEGKQ